MDVSYSFRCDTQTQLAHVRRSSWPPGGKYQLWKTASELPLHRVRDRLAVTHLQPRSSRDRFRIINGNASERDGRLQLVDSTVLRPPRHTQQIYAERSSRSDPEASTTAVGDRERRESARACTTSSNHTSAPASRSCSNRPGDYDIINGATTIQPPSRLGRESLQRWATMYSKRPVAKSSTKGETQGVRDGGERVNNTSHKQDLLELQSKSRNYHTNSTKKSVKTPPSHMTGDHGDVTPPPTPPYKGLGIGF